MTESRLAVFDPPDAALHLVSALAESAGLPVEDPFSGKVRPFLTETRRDDAEKGERGDTDLDVHLPSSKRDL